MPDITDTPYPIWTQVVNTSTTSAQGGTPSGGGRTRDDSLTALSEILGWRINKGDADGIQRALGAAFTINRDEDGASEVTWVPRGLRVQVNRSGVATITGAQRSLFERAKAMVEQVKPLLAGLESLIHEDEEDVESIHALIEPELEDLLDQFGAEGGPVPQRVDHLFDLLAGYNPAAPLARLTPENVNGQLEALREDLGLDAARVNTIEEELHLTNFQTVVAYIDTLRTMWHSERASFNRKDDKPFLGTQTVLIERALTCVAQSLQEVEFALDSVFVSADERATLSANIDGIDVTFTEIFSWIEDVVTRDGFDAIRFSGKDGLEYHLAPTLARLANIVTSLLNFIDADADKEDAARTLPESFSTVRVMTALDELQKHLANAARRAGHVKRPAPKIAKPRIPIFQLPIAATLRASRKQPLPPNTEPDPIVGQT